MESNFADVSGLPVNIPVVKEATALDVPLQLASVPEFFHQWQKPETPGSLGTDAHTRPGKA